LARIGLTLIERLGVPHEVIDAGGHIIPLAYRRLATTVFLGDHPALLLDAWFDTGAYLTILPQDAWDHPGVRDRIEWLNLPPGSLPLSPLTVMGGRYPFRLGRVTMTAIDLRTKRRLSSPVIAKFVEDAAAPRPLERILIGLRHGLLDGRRLVLEPDAPRAYLEDR
jgi:hypothetical protein